MEGRFAARPLLVLLFVVPVLGCSGDSLSPTDPGLPPPSVSIQLTGPPQVVFINQTGKTNVIVQFIARDRNDLALTPDEIVVELLLNGAPIDNESVLEEDAEELSSSIHLGLVLDASYSMLLHSPPAFIPMLEAARAAIVSGQELYAGRAGTFTWSLTWFNEFLYYPGGGGRAWVPGDIVTIPAPGPGTATKLFAAVASHVERMAAIHANVANGPHDHHIMVVFSDGADNYSWFDNTHQSSHGVTSSGAQFLVTGYGAATLDTALGAIAAHPGLTTYAIGLGSDVRDDQLLPIANAGGGRYFKNPAANQVGWLFERVTREFATIQTRGATIPLPPGNYDFRLRVLSADRRARDEYTFAFRAGDGDAGVLP